MTDSTVADKETTNQDEDDSPPLPNDGSQNDGLAQDDDVSVLSAASGGQNPGQNIPQRIISRRDITNIVDRQNHALSISRPVQMIIATGNSDESQPLPTRWREMASREDDLLTSGINFAQDEIYELPLQGSDNELSYDASSVTREDVTTSQSQPSSLPELPANVGIETTAARFDATDTTMRFFKGMGFSRDPRIALNNDDQTANLSDNSYLTDDSGNFVFKTQKTKHRTVEGTPEEYAGLRLLQILDDIRAPRAAFDRIFDWIDFSRSHGYDFETNPMTKLKHFRTGMRKKYRDYGVIDPMPKQVPVNIFVLDKEGNLKEQEMLVNIWEFKEVMVSLMSDVSIWGNPDNLNLNQQNPFLPMDNYEQAGDWYMNTVMMKNVTGYDGRFLVPLVASTDECPLTANTRFNGQPFLITTTLIKRSLWKHRHVWRCLSLIPSEKQDVSQAGASLARQRPETKFISSANYHRVMEKAIESIIKVQRRTIPISRYNDGISYKASHEEGFFTMVTLGEVQRPMQCLFPFAGLILDGKERTRQTCQLQSKTVDSPRISTPCTCTHEQCGDPFEDCELLCASDIAGIYDNVMKEVSTPKEQRIKTIHALLPQHCALHPVENAWWKADFGYSHGGIYTNCYVDPMHALRGGTIPRIIETQIGNYGQNNKARTVIDAGCKRLLQLVRNSSKSRFPRSDFDRGITAHTFLACHEWVGVLFSLTMLGICGSPTERKAVLCRKINKRGLDKDGQQLSIEERSLFNQICLLFEAWVCYGPVTDLFEESVTIQEPPVLFVSNKDEDAQDDSSTETDTPVSSPIRKKARNNSHPDNNNSDNPFADEPQTDAVAIDKEVQELFADDEKSKSSRSKKKKRKEKGGLTNAEKGLDNYDDDSSVDEGENLNELELDDTDLRTFSYRTHSYDTYNRARYWSTIRAISSLHLQTSSRTEGDGNKLPKHHDVYCHLLEMIIQSGGGMTYDAGVTENLHKPFVKEPGKTARKMSQTMFNKELSERIAQRLFELQCRNLLGIPEDKTINETKIEKYENVPLHRTIYINGTNKATYVFPGRADGRISFRGPSPSFMWDRPGTKSPNIYIQRAAIVECEEYLKENKLSYPRRDWEFFTELRSKKNGTIFRAHPNYQSLGEWYDWCLIQWSSTFERGNGAIHTRDLFDLKIRGSGFKEVLTHLGDHCNDADIRAPFSEPVVGNNVRYYVPAKILGFVRFLDECQKPKVKVLVHSCDTYCRTNSLLTREWKLLPGPPERHGKVAPVIFADLKDVVTPIRVVEKEPGFHPNFDNSETPLRVYEVFDRRNSWGERFVRIVRSGIFNLFKGNTKKTLKQGMVTLEKNHLESRCEQSKIARRSLDRNMRLFLDPAADVSYDSSSSEEVEDSDGTEEDDQDLTDNDSLQTSDDNQSCE